MKTISNEYFKDSIAGTRKDFIKFIDVNYNDLEDERCNDEELDFLAQRIALNLYYYNNNLDIAKSDYLLFLAILKKKGYLYKKKSKKIKL